MDRKAHTKMNCIRAFDEMQQHHDLHQSLILYLYRLLATEIKDCEDEAFRTIDVYLIKSPFNPLLQLRIM